MRYAGYSPSPVLAPLPYSRRRDSDYRSRVRFDPNAVFQTARTAGFGLLWIAMVSLAVILLIGSLSRASLG